MATYTSRQFGGLLITAIGAMVIGSGLLINPWGGRLWLGPRVIDYAAVLQGYAISSLVIGLAIVILGVAFGKAKRRWLDRVTIVVLVLGGAWLGDRFLLTRLNLTIWRFDPELHYVHREGAVRYLRPGAQIRINSLGFHDDEFPRAKPAGEYRGLMLGDSVTMGLDQPYEETSSQRLEQLLIAGGGPFQSVQVINAGVHGYSTRQELVLLRRSLDLEPDFVTIGFCLNDVSEPFLVDEDFGGFGLDYHGVNPSANPLIGYFSNETGVGRWLQMRAYRHKRYDLEKRAELFSVREMAGKPADDPKFKAGWELALASLEQIYAVAGEHDIPVLLLIFPFRFQLLQRDLRRPQQILSSHARQHDVPYIDFADVFRDLIFDDDELLALMRKHYSDGEVEAFYGWKFDQYFLDHDHFTPAGNDVVAQELYDRLRGAGEPSPRHPK